ncbi:MAG TPA: acetylxylan esterase [Chthonomonadaceae bacterium]|nr:acetylxylan esterase [Chthonomonadaceae bacterium]
MRMRSLCCLLLLVMGVVMGTPGAPTMPVSAQSELPTTDTRASVPPHNLDTHRTFPAFHSLAEWEAKRDFIRQQILVSSGLYPLPPKTPLQARVFDKVVRDGYTIEKAYFQTYPGFYLAGNLYRPLKAEGEKHPGVLIAHGHWGVGRMADTPDGSIPARAITFARQGYVAFTYDMVGYNDTRQIQHRVWANDQASWLWGVSEMGLQTWNSIRALDFLSSLSDVDTRRLAITGESGGGTQTMILGALDDRLAAVGPCVMVSHTMQGGCLCENAPGLRVDFSNMEVAACAAPKPQIMVGASGDWTQTMITVEGPGVESVYKLYGKPDHLKYVLFNYGHNINKTSREAVYDAFGHWLLPTSSVDFHEPPYQMEPVEALRVFPDNQPLPKDALTPEQLTESLIALGKSEVENRKPHDSHSLAQFKKTFLPAWQHTLAVEMPTKEGLRYSELPEENVPGYIRNRMHFGRAGKGDSLSAWAFFPHSPNGRMVILTHSDGKAALLAGDKPGPLVAAILEKGYGVLVLDCFLTGDLADAKALAARKRPFGEFFDTYNRTNLQERVQDLMTACAVARNHYAAKSVTLVGQGQAGLWALLAAPAADAVAADCAQLDLTTDAALLDADLYAPCLRRLGDFHTAAVLAAPHPLLLHNTGAKFTAAAWIGEVYHALGANPALHTSADRMDDSALAAWITEPRH